MTLVPADPAIDPKIAVKPEAFQRRNPAGETRFTMRPVQPSICW
jgi:hypothetical protein